MKCWQIVAVLALLFLPVVILAAWLIAKGAG